MILIVVLNLLSGSLHAQSGDRVPELVSDRPDTTESSKVVPVRLVQLELGWIMTRSEAAGAQVTINQFPAALTRIGIHNRIELRAGWLGALWSSTSGTNTEVDVGVGDMELGTKVYLWEEDSLVPEAAVLMGLSLPVGSQGFKSNQVDPGFLFAFSNSLTRAISLGYNIGLRWTSGESAGGGTTRDSFVKYSVSLATGLSSRMGAFVEFFGDTALSFDGGSAKYVDGGITFLAAQNLQLDASVGLGISRQAADWFVGCGLVFRLPR